MTDRQDDSTQAKRDERKRIREERRSLFKHVALALLAGRGHSATSPLWLLAKTRVFCETIWDGANHYAKEKRVYERYVKNNEEPEEADSKDGKEASEEE